MSRTELDRVREDLATMRSAAGFGSPFGRDDVAGNLAVAAVGACFAAWMAFGGERLGRTPTYLFMAALVAVGTAVAVRARRRRGSRPELWREQRANLLAAVVIAPAVMAYLRWEMWLGMPRETAGAAALFFVGLGLLLVPILSPKRFAYAGAAVPLMAFGLALPFCDARGSAVAAGLCLTAAGLATAALQTWQLRSDPHASAAG